MPRLSRLILFLLTSLLTLFLFVVLKDEPTFLDVISCLVFTNVNISFFLSLRDRYSMEKILIFEKIGAKMLFLKALATIKPDAMTDHGSPPNKKTITYI